jgi:ABC-type multidrug transport system ATPase subunit
MRFQEIQKTEASAILRMHDVGFVYPQRPLFVGLSASLNGGVMLVCGGDGRGKTTLLRLLAGELPLQSGQVKVKGLCAATQNQAYRQQVYWIDPRSSEFDQITALHFFDQLRLRYPGFPGAEAPRLDELVTGLSLAPHIDKPLYMLSTGSKRKVWLAGAFAAGAALTLLDDPMAALDKPSIGFVLEQLRAAASDQARVCVVAGYEAPADVPLVQVIDLGD